MALRLTKQQALLAALVAVFAVVWYFREQLGVIVADYAGEYWPLPDVGKPYADTIKAASVEEGVPFDLLARELWQESRFNPSAVNSGSGATGIAQFMPATAAQLGIDPLDPSQAIPAMAGYLTTIQDYIESKTSVAATWAMALAGYNWGMGNVVKALNTYGDQWLANAPTETRAYVGGILSDVPLEPLPAGAIT
ncbi:MAG TPA: lytic transglycosylase domain-containing protein [Gammaproteobacteria bacterium]|jgi:soluble lytic murein transglycosylase-like protein